MTEWREASLDDLCARITSGGTPSRKRSDYFCAPPDGHAWVKSQELLDRRITATSEHITDGGLRGSSAKELPVGAVLIAMYGANVGQLGYLGIEATVNQAVCALIADAAVADPRFVYYALAHSRDDLGDEGARCGPAELEPAADSAVSPACPKARCSATYWRRVTRHRRPD